MATRGRPISRFKVVRLWLHRLAFFLLAAASIGLLALNRVEQPWASRLRAGLMDGLAPIAQGLSMPARAVSDWFGTVKDTTQLQHENAELKAEIDKLRLKIQSMDQAARDNAEFRSLLSVKLPDEGKHIVGRVIADPGGPYVRSLLIRVGSRDGVRRGRAVITAQGLIGRITEVGDNTSRVMLVTDVNARTAVVIGDAGERAIMTGANAELPRLLHVSRVAKIAKGDKVFTSGHDGVLPAGLPVGEIAEIGDRGVRIRLHVSTQNFGYVRVIDHEMPGLLPPPSGDRPNTRGTRRRQSAEEPAQ